MVINVGTGEGYYAVGLLTRMPSIQLVAFEATKCGQSSLEELAVLNGVEKRLEVRGICGVDNLVDLLGQHESPLIIMDVEGAEALLLDPKACCALRNSKILVEVHDYLRPGTSTLLLDWYRCSHEIKRIPTVGIVEMKIPQIGQLSKRAIRVLADEMRPARMEWFWMTPRHY